MPEIGADTRSGRFFVIDRIEAGRMLLNVLASALRANDFAFLVFLGTHRRKRMGTGIAEELGAGVGPNHFPFLG